MASTQADVADKVFSIQENSHDAIACAKHCARTTPHQRCLPVTTRASGLQTHFTHDFTSMSVTHNAIVNVKMSVTHFLHCLSD